MWKSAKLIILALPKTGHNSGSKLFSKYSDHPKTRLIRLFQSQMVTGQPFENGTDLDLSGYWMVSKLDHFVYKIQFKKRLC
jgi:hypothetical protein